MTASKQDFEPVRHNLDLDESLDLHVRRWRVRTWAPALVFAVIMLTALGLFGGGVLSDVTVIADGQGLRYERFARAGKDIRLQAYLANGADTVRLPLESLTRTAVVYPFLLLVITFLVGIDLLLAKVKQTWAAFEKVAEGAPLIIVERGKPLRIRMTHAGVDENDMLETARMKHGLERMAQIRYAIQERDGAISIIPEPPAS